MATGRIAGLTLIKVDGTFELDALNATWDTDRGLTQHVTGAGIENAIGVEMPSFSFDEVIDIQGGATDWRNKKDFRLDIYDKETRTKIIHSQSRCNWNKVGGTSENSSASTKQKISGKGSDVNKL